MFHSRSLSYDRSIAPSKVSSPQCELVPSLPVCSNFSFPYCYPVAAYVLFLLLLSLLHFRLPFLKQRVLEGNVLATCHKCLCMFMSNHRANWHSSATLTEVFSYFFLSCKANARVKPAKMRHGLYSSKIFVLFYVLCVLCRSVYYLCVNVYCTTAIGWLPNCS